MRRVPTLHVVGLPHTDFSGRYPACAFTSEVIRFVEMMSQFGYEIVAYGAGAHKCPHAVRTVSLLTEAEMLAATEGFHYTSASFDISLPHWERFNRNAIAALGFELKHKPPEEHIVCIIGGLAHKPIHDAFPAHIVCEIGVGYVGSFSKYRVFRSHAWQSATYGLHSMPLWTDDVIPGFLSDRTFVPFEGARPLDPDYLMFAGRLIENKGLHVAEQVAKEVGLPLLVCGEGPLKRETEDGIVHFVGEVSHEERDGYMAHARAVLMPSLYNEPFGYVAIEAMANGCPVITPDWGAFPETVINGVSGWRCRNLSDFCEAVRTAEFIDREAIKSYALGNFSLQAVGPRYDAYFKRLAALYGKGWYA